MHTLRLIYLGLIIGCPSLCVATQGASRGGLAPSYTHLAPDSTQMTLTGRILSRQSQSPIEDATLYVLRPDGSALATAQSDSLGYYRLTFVPPRGEYTIGIRCIGYTPLRLTAERAQGTLYLEEDQHTLREVSVMASHTTRRRTGELIVRLRNNPIAEGKPLHEVLRFIPGLNVNESELKVHGRAGTLIYLEDRKITFEELKNLSPSLIDRIEVQPQASAEHGAKATGGVLYIHLRQEGGLLGSLTTQGQVDRAGFVEAKGTLGLLYRRGKYSLHAGLTTGIGKYDQQWERHETMGTTTEDCQLQDENRSRALMGNLGLKYTPRPNQTLSVYSSLTLGHSDLDKVIRPQGRTPLTSLHEERERSYTLGTTYKAEWGENNASFFKVKVEYASEHSDADRTYHWGGKEKNNTSQALHHLLAQPKLFLLLPHRQGLNLGLTYGYLRDQNTAEGIATGSLSMIQKSDFQVEGHDYSPWVGYSWHDGNRFFVAADLLYHYSTGQLSDRFIPDYSANLTYRGLYPSLQLQYLISKERESSLGLSLRRSYSLPNYGYYAPRALVQTDRLYGKGSLHLRQEIFYRGELSYQVNPNLSFTYNVSLGEDIIHIMTRPDPQRPGVYYTTPENIGSRLRHHLSSDLELRPLHLWRSNTNVYLQHQRDYIPGRSVESTSVGIQSTHQFTLPRGFGLSLSFDASTGTKTLSYEQGGDYSMSLGGWGRFLGDRLTVGLRFSNLLHNTPWIRISQPGLEVLRTETSRLTRAKLTLVWKFRSGKKIKQDYINSVTPPARLTPTL